MCGIPTSWTFSKGRRGITGSVPTLSTKNHFLPDRVGPPLQLLASVTGAFCAVSCCLPFDLVMVRYQTEPGKYRGGIGSCVRTIWREGGMAAFFRGWTPLFARISIIFSVYMPAYEQVRARVFAMGYFK